MLSEDDLAQFFTDFTSSAFRLELLDRYIVPDEADYFARFRRGDPFPDDWHDNPWVAGIVASGRTMSRVHVVHPPLSTYLEFELGWAYPGNVASGEDIRIIDTAEQQVDGLPDHDFWLFDDRTVVRLVYTLSGEFEGAIVLPETEAPRYRTYRDTAWAQAVPYREYWSTRHA